MKRALSALGVTGIGLAMLLSYKTPDPTAPAAASGADGSSDEAAAINTTTTTAVRSGTAGTGNGATATTTTTTAKASSASAAAYEDGTFTGASASTRWGDVQVQVTIANGKITNVEAVDYPSENPKDVSINSRALPALKQEALAAQSASIDTVSGATVTSNGYIESLQSALDTAKG